MNHIKRIRCESKDNLTKGRGEGERERETERDREKHDIKGVWVGDTPIRKEEKKR